MSSRGTKDLKKLFVFGGYILTVIVLISFLVTGLVIRNQGDQIEFKKKAKLKKFLHFNPLTNETSVGVVSIFRDLNRDESIHFVDDHGSHTLISNFGSGEYRCTGICVCEEENGRRSTLTFSNGLIYLVSAITSLVAYSKAKSYFEERCIEELSEVCSQRSVVRTETDSCELYLGENEEEHVEGHRKYFCRGSCIEKRFKKGMTWRSLIDFNCEELENEGYVGVMCLGFEASRCYEKARAKFQKVNMTPFCKDNSQRTRYYITPNGLRKKYSVKLCVSSNTNGRNPTVHCRQVFPLPFK